jgi:hypothetical protein
LLVVAVAVVVLVVVAVLEVLELEQDCQLPQGQLIRLL